MFNIGPQELLVILLLALIVVGPQRLPEIARTIGRGMREFRKMQDEVKDMVKVDLNPDPPAVHQPGVSGPKTTARPHRTPRPRATAEPETSDGAEADPGAPRDDNAVVPAPTEPDRADDTRDPAPIERGPDDPPAAAGAG
jgi:sec-independent protein translocase protein TatB